MDGGVRNVKGIVKYQFGDSSHDVLGEIVFRIPIKYELFFKFTAIVVYMYDPLLI